MRDERGEMLKMAGAALAAFNVLFARPDPAGEPVPPEDAGGVWLRCYHRALTAIRRELELPEADAGNAGRYAEVPEPGVVDSVDAMNALTQVSEGRSFAENLERAVFGALCRHGVNSRTLADISAPEAAEARYFFRHALKALEALALFRRYPAYLKKLYTGDFELSRLRPELSRLASVRGSFPDFKVGVDSIGGLPLSRVGEILASYDRFGGERAFRYIAGRFVPVDTSSIRKPGEFFGYAGVRHSFADHFRRFAEGIGGEPLLVSGLPGLGKTQFTMAFALDRPELTLVLAGPDELEHGLENLLAELRDAGEHRFVVFFDDIDPRTLDWYWFRTNIGGALSMPGNVMVALAANNDFPASILSRGRGISFPVFDVGRCEEMVEDFLKFKGLREPSRELVGVIAADYTEEFGQKRFPELSPRTLIRYLRWYDSDAAKRRRLLEMSKLELVPRPDPQLFQEFNLKQIQLLYGGDKVLETIGGGFNG